MIIYVLVLVAIVVGRRRKNEALRSSFFTLTLSIGVADILQYLRNWTLAKFRFWGLFYEFYASLEPVYTGFFISLYTSDFE